MKIDILGGSYRQKYREFNSQKTINWYPVVTAQEEKSKSQTAIFPTPGLTTFVNPPGRYNRGIYTSRTHTFPGRCFTVVDTTLYEITVQNGYINRGSLAKIGTGASRVWMVDDANDELGIFHYNASYVFNMDTNTLTQITSNQFPGQVTYADFLDGYTIIVSSGSTYYAPTNNMLTGWLSTQVFSPTFKPAPVIAAIALREEIYNFTSVSCEIYINDGSSPYSRLPRSTIYIGLAAKESVALTNDGFYFLGRNRVGETAIYFFDSYYTVKNVAPTSIVWTLDNFNGTVDDAYGYIQNTKDGHQFYYITIPALNSTYVFDTTTNMYHERKSQVPSQDSNGDTNQNVFRGRHYTNFNGINLFSDLYSGKVFVEDFNNFTEDGQSIHRHRISETFSEDYQNITIHSLEFDMNTGYGALSGQGVTPRLVISYSKDGGYNYHPLRTMNIGALGDHIFRARLFKLGTARNWTFKISLSDPIDVMINNCIVRGAISVN